ncbi:hypothetical protein FRC17_005599 [Serendipita sp. 399]|nr:hypothetical protein FRC17_005599 [Serendipita sp. 399]
MPDADWNDGIPDMRVMDAEVALEDHQLLVNISASEENPAIFNWLGVLDNDAADGPGYGSIEPAFVPHGVIMDDPNELLEYSDSGWQHIRDWFSYEDTTSITSKPGAWMQVAFSGKSIWVYGRIPVEGVVFSLEVIKKYGPVPSRNVTIYNLTRSDLDVPIYRFPLLAHKDLEYANAYSYNITLISGTLAIDFVGVDGKLVPSNFGDIHSTDRVDPPQPIQTAFDPKVVIPVVFGVTFALLLCALSFFLFKRYRARRTLRLGFGIDEPGECDKPIVQSSHPSFIGPAHIIPTLTRYPRSSSSCLTSNNNSTFAESMSSGPERTSSPDLESQDPSRMSREEYVMEDGEPLSLSHADLATVFRRAEELRSRGPQEGEATLGELEPHLEALARQLANSTQ